MNWLSPQVSEEVVGHAPKLSHATPETALGSIGKPLALQSAMARDRYAPSV